MGVVYRARHEVIGRSVAIKVLRAEYREDTDMVERVLREARMLGSLEHPGIIDVHTFGVLKNGQPYLVTELLEGESLDAFVRREAPALVKTVVPIVDEVLASLLAAHAVGVVHRDLKPGNIFLKRNAEGLPTVKLLDFGLARRAEKSGDSIKPTHPNTMVGTPAFMAPEQVMGASVTAATDLYAVGGIAYQLLTGKLPHEAPNAVEILTQKMNHPPLSPRKWVPSLDEDLCQWVLWLLEREVKKRPQTAEQARAKLRRLAASKTLPEGVAKVKVQAKTVPVESKTEPSGLPTLGAVPNEGFDQRPTQLAPEVQTSFASLRRNLGLWGLLGALVVVTLVLLALLMFR
jgi:eukaryotic-like serine/threonine-protein kinase